MRLPSLFKPSRRKKPRGLPPDIDDDARAIIETVSPFSMTSPERLLALRDAVRHVCRHGIEGDIVECGVWRGGSMMAAALTMLECGGRRRIHLFDTFEGMPPPAATDRDLTGVAAATLLAAEQRESGDTWAFSPLDQVRANLRSTGYPAELVRFVPGRVEETIPEAAPERIAVLRLIERKGNRNFIYEHALFAWSEVAGSKVSLKKSLHAVFKLCLLGLRGARL